MVLDELSPKFPICTSATKLGHEQPLRVGERRRPERILQ
jgi:hypothetical protein